ncbi:hypothetical protein CEXT_159411 [Caerostris extrusa]|uniref:Uncharacterized protein n=1 Tax=Caerostris extrusa TaxID=172846 RepID=A0AAV4T1T2_CAEEX|nr:hypothetical protein CEXT_159411 [Caerostris extrusa]
MRESKIDAENHRRVPGRRVAAIFAHESVSPPELNQRSISRPSCVIEHIFPADLIANRLRSALNGRAATSILAEDTFRECAPAPRRTP